MPINTHVPRNTQPKNDLERAAYPVLSGKHIALLESVGEGTVIVSAVRGYLAG